MILTKRQREIFDFIQDGIDKRGYAPTLEEIGKHFQLRSLATVHKHVANLENKGLIRRKWNHSRSIEVVSQTRGNQVDDGTPGAVDLPLLGLVAAGRPIEAVDTSNTVVVPENFLGRGNTFALRVRGDSMRDEGILDNDVIVVTEKPQPNNGDMVVAAINGEATVKRFYRERDRSVRLQPANDNYDPIVIKGKDLKGLQIKGIVSAVLRRYQN